MLSLFLSLFHTFVIPLLSPQIYFITTAAKLSLSHSYILLLPLSLLFLCCLTFFSICFLSFTLIYSVFGLGRLFQFCLAVLYWDYASLFLWQILSSLCLHLSSRLLNTDCISLSSFYPISSWFSHSLSLYSMLVFFLSISSNLVYYNIYPARVRIICYSSVV